MQLVVRDTSAGEDSSSKPSPPPRSIAPQASEMKSTPDHVNFFRFGCVAIELVALACLMHRFNVESAAFRQVFLLAVAGFVVHYFIPHGFRPALFLALSLASIVLVLGVAQSAWLVALGVGLIALVHLPVPLPARVGALFAAGLGLALLRAGWGAVPWSGAVWPVLGAMFMFRLIVYAYDVHHGHLGAGWIQRLSYFFMLPNVCFPLFPVVDSRTFERSYFAADRHDTYQRGVEWILRGAIQLILYRIAYTKLGIHPLDVVTSFDFVHYMLWLFLLYLRVSGQFHVIVGILHLFGFHLPETHHRYYFAASFTDFWRRINIYWKDFMMKVFYYPAFFRTKHLGTTQALVLSTAVVFALTWALHAYQLFWIRGHYVFTWNDLLFWTILCGLVTVNALWEAKRGRRRSLAPKAPSMADRAKTALKTLATFVAICVLWGFWSSPSVAAWLGLWHAALTPPTAEQQSTLALVAIGVVLSLVVLGIWDRWVAPRIATRWMWRASTSLTQLVIINLISITAVSALLGPAGSLVAAARYGGLNEADLVELERGYYEDLLTVDRFNSELASLYAKRPPEWERSLEDVGLSVPAPALSYALRPDASGLFKGAMLRTNKWGMHDQDYDLEKAPGTIRVGVLGASHTMGVGVEREDTFEAVLERRLNSPDRPDSPGRIEILNFAVYGYYPLEQLKVFDQRIGRFQCDVMLYVGHPGDDLRVAHYLGGAISRRTPPADPWIEQIVQRAGVDPQLEPGIIQRKLRPLGEELLAGLYREMVARCDAEGVRPVFVLLPMVPEAETAAVGRESDLARAAGFTVFDLDDVYAGQDRRSLWIAEWDAHPNALGHSVVADRLFRLVTEQGDELLTQPPR
jgi:hypothetical protein